jgi:hypothetical protein
MHQSSKSFPLMQAKQFLFILQELVMGSEPLVQLNLEINPKQNFHQIYLYIFLCHAPFRGMLLKQGLGHSRSINIRDNDLCFKIGILLESPLTHSFGPCTFPS